MNYFLGELMTS